MSQTLTDRVEAIKNTPGTGELVQIAEINSAFDKFDHHFIPACKIQGNAQQTITSGVGQVQLLYDTTVIDTYAARSEGAMAELANDRIRIRKAGLYMLRVNTIFLAGTAAGILRLDMAVNGTTDLSTFDHGVAQASSLEAWQFRILAVNDLITAFVQQTTGANRTIDDNTYPNINCLEAIWLGNATEV
jgi:hypothetical protein